MASSAAQTSACSDVEDLELPSVPQCSAYMVVLKHLQKQFRIPDYCLDLIGALLLLFKRDSWRVVQAGGQLFQFRKFPDGWSFRRTSWKISGWHVAYAPVGSELVSGEVLNEEVGNIDEPFTVIENHLSLEVHPDSDSSSEGDSRGSSSGDYDSAAEFIRFPGGRLIRRRVGEGVGVQMIPMEEGGEEEQPVEVDEEVELSVRNLMDTFDSVAER